MSSAREYALFGQATVEGWLSPIDSKLFLAFDAIQQSLHIRGDLLEIGAFRGKSAILLGYFARPDEDMIVVDPFGDDGSDVEQRAETERWYRGLTRLQFEENYSRFHTRHPRILQGMSSTQIDHVTSRSCRFIHIDGSHEFTAVRTDIQNALRVATPESTLVLDDIRSEHTPGVAASGWEAVLDGRLVPLVQTAKLYASLPGAGITAPILADFLSDAGLEVVESHRVLDHPILEIRESRGVLRPSRSRRIASEIVPPVILKVARRVRRQSLNGSDPSILNY